MNVIFGSYYFKQSHNVYQLRRRCLYYKNDNSEPSKL